MKIEERWTITTEDGAEAIDFTSFIDIDVQDEGQALTYPVEEGGFANYNKVMSPNVIRVTISKQGQNPEFESIIKKLEEYQTQPIKLFITTPSYFYGPVTLETYSNTRKQDSGAGQLTVECTFVEVREVKTQVTTTVVTRPKNATSSNKNNNGKTQTEGEETADGKKKRRSVLKQIGDYGRS